MDPPNAIKNSEGPAESASNHPQPLQASGHLFLTQLFRGGGGDKIPGFEYLWISVSMGVLETEPLRIMRANLDTFVMKDAWIALCAKCATLLDAAFPKCSLLRKYDYPPFAAVAETG